jgi:hypothetical protein
MPLRDFAVENLRILICQSTSLEYTVPLALEHLSKDPLVSGDFCGIATLCFGPLTRPINANVRALTAITEVRT